MQHTPQPWHTAHSSLPRQRTPQSHVLPSAKSHAVERRLRARKLGQFQLSAPAEELPNVSACKSSAQIKVPGETGDWLCQPVLQQTWCSLSAGSCLNKLPERMELSIPHTALWSGINKQRLAGTPGMAGLDGIVHYLPCSWEDSLKIGLTIRTNKKKIEALRASSSHQLLPHLLNATPPGMSQAKISQRNRLQKHLITSTNERQL